MVSGGEWSWMGEEWVGNVDVGNVGDIGNGIWSVRIVGSVGGMGSVGRGVGTVGGRVGAMAGVGSTVRGCVWTLGGMGTVGGGVRGVGSVTEDWVVGSCGWVKDYGSIVDWEGEGREWMGVRVMWPNVPGEGRRRRVVVSRRRRSARLIAMRR